MRLPIFLILLTTLGGCSGTFERMDAWMGVGRESVLNSFGRPPDRIGRDRLGEWMRWRRYEDGICSDRFTFQNERVVGYASDCGLWGGWSAPRAPAANQ